MSAFQDNLDDMNQMILQGQILEAFDKYYADDVIMQDNESPAREGKAACRVFEETFVNGITEFRGAELKNMMISEAAGVATSEWAFDYTHKDWGVRNVTQISAQRWKDGKIVSEKFMYNG